VWEKAQHLHVSITLVTTAKDKKKLFYFFQDAYNEASDHLQEAISNFVKPESSACDSGIDSTFRDKTKLPLLKLPRIALPKFS
ncbi:hypothetical protein HN011_001196, partial [Eciton burchellii]